MNDEPDEPQTYWRYAGIGQLFRRAYEAGCVSAREASWWIDQHFGKDQNHAHAPGPFRPEVFYGKKGRPAAEGFSAAAEIRQQNPEKSEKKPQKSEGDIGKMDRRKDNADR